MKRTWLSLGLSVILAAGIVSAASSYKITLPSNLSAGDTMLKAGDYTLTLEGKQAVLKRGKETFQIPAIVEKNDKKFSDTVLELTGSQIQSIDLGGTDMKIMFRSSH